MFFTAFVLFFLSNSKQKAKQYTENLIAKSKFWLILGQL